MLISVIWNEIRECGNSLKPNSHGLKKSISTKDHQALYGYEIKIKLSQSFLSGHTSHLKFS